LTACQKGRTLQEAAGRAEYDRAEDGPQEYQKFTDSLAVISEEYGTLKEKEAFTGAEITEIENRTQLRRIHLVEREKTLDIVQKEFQAVERNMAELNRLIAVNRQDINNFEDFHDRLLRSEEVEQRMSDLAVKFADWEQAAHESPKK